MSKNEKKIELQRQSIELQRQIDATLKRVGELGERLAAHATMAEERKKAALRLEYLQRRAAVREKYIATPITNDQRQREMYFNGIRPQKMDVVHFHVPKVGDREEKDGVALVRDENHYYIAVDMYDKADSEDGITTMMDDNPDGTFDGIWPKYVVLKAASKFEERYMRGLVDQYADDLDKAEAFVAERAEQERREMEELKPKVDEMNAQLASYDTDNAALEEARKVLILLNVEHRRVLDELQRRYPEDAHVTTATTYKRAPTSVDVETLAIGAESDSDIERHYSHLPYLRGRREMTTMLWPCIDTDMQAWLRYRLMSNVARTMMFLQQSHALTYVLSEEYLEELRNRGRSYYKGMMPEDVVPDDEAMSGVIIYPNQGFEDTVLFNITRMPQLVVLIAYIREGNLMFYESYAEQEIIGRPRTDIFICKSLRDSGTNASRLFSFLRNFVVSFLAMERDMGRAVNSIVAEGAGTSTETCISKNDAIDTTDDRDVIIRDAAWYNDITVNHRIPASGFLSHRWCGSGGEKHVRVVMAEPAGMDNG